MQHTADILRATSDSEWFVSVDMRRHGFVRANHVSWLAELVNDGVYGFDVQIFGNEEFSYSTRFPSWAFGDRVGGARTKRARAAAGRIRRALRLGFLIKRTPASQPVRGETSGRPCIWGSFPL